MQTVTGTAPSYWACYFMYGDSGDMEPDEIAAADAFAAWLGGDIVSCEDAGFMRWHDAAQWFPYASDCQEYTAIVMESV